MATTLYLQSTGASPFSPAYAADYDDTTVAVRRKMDPTRGTSALTDISFADADATDLDILHAQFTTAALAAQTYSAQAVRLVIQCYCRTGNEQYIHWKITCHKTSDDSVIGTLVDFNPDNADLGTGDWHVRLCDYTSNEVVASEENYLCLHVGQGGDPKSGNDHDGHIRIGEDGVEALSDAGGDDTDDDWPWIRFPDDTFTFAGGAGTVVQDIIGGFGIIAFQR